MAKGPSSKKTASRDASHQADDAADEDSSRISSPVPSVTQAIVENFRRLARAEPPPRIEIATERPEAALESPIYTPYPPAANLPQLDEEEDSKRRRE
jgi:hypothetical protein